MVFRSHLRIPLGACQDHPAPGGPGGVWRRRGAVAGLGLTVWLDGPATTPTASHCAERRQRRRDETQKVTGEAPLWVSGSASGCPHLTRTWARRGRSTAWGLLVFDLMSTGSAGRRTGNAKVDRQRPVSPRNVCVFDPDTPGPPGARRHEQRDGRCGRRPERPPGRRGAGAGLAAPAPGRFRISGIQPSTRSLPGSEGRGYTPWGEA